MAKGVIILVAGGTGGHLFPAQALNEELTARGYEVHLMTDKRAYVYAKEFAKSHIHVVRSATFTRKNPWALLKTLWQLFCGVRQSRKLYRKLRPNLVVGFGGYPTFPPLYAATVMGILTMIHEQNAVLGRANKALAGRVGAIACGFKIQNDQWAEKIIVTGNPVRKAVLDACKVPYQPSKTPETFNLLVFGGSQGAEFFSHIMPKAIALLSLEQQRRLNIIQQVPGATEPLVKVYKDAKIDAEVARFFEDMAEKIALAQFIIARAGASTVAEIAAIGRPALFVPYPNSLDHDQAANAAELSESGGVDIFKQSELDARKLGQIISDAMNQPNHLLRRATMVRRLGKRDAAKVLANLAEALISGKHVKDLKGLPL